jgi:hypothetical protein
LATSPERITACRLSGTRTSRSCGALTRSSPSCACASVAMLPTTMLAAWLVLPIGKTSRWQPHE